MSWLEIFTYSLVGLVSLGILFQGFLALIESVVDE